MNELHCLDIAEREWKIGGEDLDIRDQQDL